VENSARILKQLALIAKLESTVTKEQQCSPSVQVNCARREVIALEDRYYHAQLERSVFLGLLFVQIVQTGHTAQHFQHPKQTVLQRIV